MRFTMSLNFRLICYEWQGLRASVLPDRRQQRPETATATGNGDDYGKDNDKSTLSQLQSSGARRRLGDTKEEGDEEEARDEDPGERPRKRQLGEAEGRRGKGMLNKFC